MQRAHQKGIIHRDLKPSNVLIALYDGKPVPKVIDFGIAKAMGQQLTDKTLFTGFGGIVGTLEYMSPEQAELNQLDIDTRSDIYSLGVMLYEILTGSTPLDRKQLQRGALLEVLRLIREVEPPTPSTRLSTLETSEKPPGEARTELIGSSKLLRGEVDWIVMKALEKDRNRRYETANSFAEDIRRYLADEPVHAGPPSTGYRLRKFVKRNAAAVTAASIVLLTLVLGMVGTTGGMVWAMIAEGEADQQRRDAQTQEKRAVAAEGDALDKAKRAENEAEAAKKARDQAQRLAIAEKNARAQAEKNEKAAKDQTIRAERGEEAARRNLLETQQTLFTAQIARAGSIWKSDPAQGKTLLRDLKVCPIPERDFTWHLHYRMCDRERTLYRADSIRVCAALSPDAKLLASGGANGATHVWDSATGKLLHRLFVNPGTVHALLFARDSRTLTTVESRSGEKTTRVRRWDLATGDCLDSKDLAVQVKGAAFHPDGKWMATRNYQNHPKPPTGSQRYHMAEVTLWNLHTGEGKALEVAKWRGALCVAFSPDAKYLAAGQSGGPVRLWRTDTAATYADFQGSNTGWVHDLCFTRDSKFLLFGSASQRVHYWDIEKKKELPPFAGGHVLDVQGVVLSPNERYLLSGDMRGGLCVREVANGFGPENAGPLMVFPCYSSIAQTRADGPMPMLFTPDGCSFIAEKGNNLIRVELPLQAEERTLRAHSDGITALAFSPDNTLLASVSKDKTARLTEVANGKTITMGTFPDQPSSVAFAPDGQTVFVGANVEIDDKKLVGQIARFDVKSGKLLAPWLGNHSKIISLAISPRHRLLAAASSEGVRLWDLRLGREVPLLDGPLARGAHSLAWHPTDKLLALVVNGSVNLWDLNETPYRVKQVPGLRVSAFGGPQIAFSASGDYLLANGVAVIASYDLRNNKAEPKLPRRKSDSITSFAITPDEKTLALGLADRTIELWDLPSGQLRATLTGHILEVTALAFSPDGKMLASGDKNRNDSVFWVRGGLIKLWNGRPERPIGHELSPFLLQFSKDARRLMSTTAHSQIVWDVVSGQERFGANGADNVLTPDGRRFLRLNMGNAAWTVVDIDTHKELGTIEGAGMSLLFCDGNLAAGYDPTKKVLQFWDLDTCQIVKIRPAPAPPQLMSPDGRTVVYAGFSKDARGQFVNARIAMDLETQRETVIPFDPKVHGFPVGFAGNDQLIFWTFTRCSIWDIRAGKFNAITIQGRKLLSFSTDGQTLAAVDSAADGREWQVRAWSLADGKERCDPAPIPRTSPVALALTRDGHVAVATVEDTGVKFWPRVKLR